MVIGNFSFFFYSYLQSILISCHQIEAIFRTLKTSQSLQNSTSSQTNILDLKHFSLAIMQEYLFFSTIFLALLPRHPSYVCNYFFSQQSVVAIPLHQWQQYHFISGSNAIVSVAAIPLYQWQRYHCISGSNTIVSVVAIPLYQWQQYHYISGSNTLVSVAVISLCQWQLYHCISGSDTIISLVVTPLYHWQRYHCISGSNTIV